MAIRRIKAHYAIEDGEILKVVSKPNRIPNLVAFGVIALIVGLIWLPELNLIFRAITVLVVGFIGFLAGSSGIEREVPRADIVEVKRYKWPEKVTVVLDDERAKMAKPPAEPPKHDSEIINP